MSVMNKKSAMAILVAALATGLYGCSSETNNSAPAAASPESAAPIAPAAAPVDQQGASVAAVVEGFQAAERGSLTCNLDTVSGQPAGGAAAVDKTAHAVFGGWEFGHGDAGSTGAVVLSGAAGNYAAEAEVGGARADVAQAFGKPEVANSGFNAVVDLANVPAGEYAAWFTRGQGESAMVCDLKTKVTVKG